MRELIINGDDFGMSAEVNEGIKQGIEEGLVSSVSLMTNLPHFNEAVEFLRGHPEISVGLHFNITEGKPVLTPAAVGSLLKEDDSFYHWTSLLLRLILSDAKVEQAETELVAQYSQLKETGLTITHIDSHQHIHLYPPLYKALTQLAGKENIRSSRCHHLNLWSLTAGISKRPSLKQIVINLALWLNSFFHRGQNPYELNGIYDINWDDQLSREELLKILENLPTGRTELVCHLGVLSPTGNKKFLEPRQRKLNLLRALSVRRQLLRNGIRLLGHRLETSSDQFKSLR